MSKYKVGDRVALRESPSLLATITRVLYDGDYVVVWDDGFKFREPEDDIWSDSDFQDA